MEDVESFLRERGGYAYVVTVSEQGGPHAIYVPVRRHGSEFIAEVGAKTAANAAARPQLGLLYPVRAPDDYSLIIDGTAIVEPTETGPRLRIRPTRIVLHRAVAGNDPDSACGADCLPLAID
jgi:hypothetical protein